ncbi:hypothetical protein MIR68_005355 [Amoeboaphelidium protococcarum]|nr:hypothetical protein MIR68_005355 [Amoeboaphelidium protococcarum]KAI3645744.1 hypothetical protein MP228_008672 [Amoeboaphelidium protococcarum]
MARQQIHSTDLGTILFGVALFLAGWVLLIVGSAAKDFGGRNGFILFLDAAIILVLLATFFTGYFHRVRIALVGLLVIVTYYDLETYTSFNQYGDDYDKVMYAGGIIKLIADFWLIIFVGTIWAADPYGYGNSTRVGNNKTLGGPGTHTQNLGSGAGNLAGNRNLSSDTYGTQV